MLLGKSFPFSHNHLLSNLLKMDEDHGVYAPLIIAIDDVDEECLSAHSDSTDDETAHGELGAQDASLLVDQGSPGGIPRRRPGAKILKLGEDEKEEDDDAVDDRDEQPPLALEMHWIFTAIIQILTAGVALAIMSGIHEFFHAENQEVTVIFVFGALLLGGFWTASGFALTFKRSPANKPVQVILLVAPLTYLLLVPLIVIKSLPAVLLLASSFGIICYLRYPSAVGRCLASHARPKIVCIRAYKCLLLVQFTLSLLFWFGCVVEYWNTNDWQDVYNVSVALLNAVWMVFVRSLLFLDARVHITEADKLAVGGDVVPLRHSFRRDDDGALPGTR